MSANETMQFQQAAKKLAVILRCPNKGDLKFYLENGCPTVKLVMRTDTDKVLSYNGTSVHWRDVNERGKRAGWREFGSLQQFASAM